MILTIAILLGLAFTTFADEGLFQRGYNAKNGFSGYTFFNSREDGQEPGQAFNSPMLPSHGETDNLPAPVGSGIAVLMGLGCAYYVAKKRNKE